MRTALIVIDMLNRYEHDDAELLLASVHQALPAMSELVKQAHECNIPLIYVNDNYEDWTQAETVSASVRSKVPTIRLSSRCCRRRMPGS